MRSFHDRLNSMLGLAALGSLADAIGRRVQISDRKFGKVFIARVASVEFRPIEPGSNMGVDSLRFVVDGVLHESGPPVMELREKDRQPDWKIAFGNFQNAPDLEIRFL